MGVSWVEDNWGASFSGAATISGDQVNRSFGIGGFYALSRNFQLRADVVQFKETQLGRNRNVDNGLVAVLELQFTI